MSKFETPLIYLFVFTLIFSSCKKKEKVNCSGEMVCSTGFAAPPDSAFINQEISIPLGVWNDACFPYFSRAEITSPSLFSRNYLVYAKKSTDCQECRTGTNWSCVLYGFDNYVKFKADKAGTYTLDFGKDHDHPGFNVIRQIVVH